MNEKSITRSTAGAGTERGTDIEPGTIVPSENRLKALNLVRQEGVDEDCNHVLQIVLTDGSEVRLTIRIMQAIVNRAFSDDRYREYGEILKGSLTTPTNDGTINIPLLEDYE